MSCKYNGGLLLIVGVVIMWVTSAEVTQEVVFIHYKQPFAVAYLATSLLIVHLPIAFLKDWLLEFMRCQDDGETVDDSSAEPDSPVKHAAGHTGFEIEHQEPLGNASSCIDIYSEDLDPLVSACTKNRGMVKKDKNFTTREIAKFGFCIAPLWFFTEYLTNAALARTTVASTTLLSSTSGLFTLLIGACLGQDSINIVKVIAIVFSMAGVAMTTFGKTSTTDETQNGKHSSLGDLCAILSSFTYSLFTVLLKKFAGEGERVDVQKLFGCIGLFTLVVLWCLDIFKKYLAGMMASVISTSSCVAFTSHCIHMVIDRTVVFCPLLKFPWCDLIIASAALVASKQLLHMHVFNELFYFV